MTTTAAPAEPSVESIWQELDVDKPGDLPEERHAVVDFLFQVWSGALV